MINNVFTNEYWDEESLSVKLPCVWSPLSDLELYGQMDRYINRLFKNNCFTVFEIGCAPGRYLAFFGNKYNCKLYGIDKSSIGVKVTEDNFTISNLQGTIFHGDVFDLPDEIKDTKYDIVMSHGFVEHFLNLNEIMGILFGLTKNNGLVITTIPNFNGISGYLTKILSPNIYDAHEKYEPKDFINIQEKLGAKILFCNYTGHYQLRLPFKAHSEFKKRHYIFTKTVNLPFYFLKGFFYSTWPLLRYVLPPHKLFSKRLSSIAYKA